MRKKIIFLLVLIVLAAFSIRLHIAFSSQGFSDDTSFFYLRQMQHIREVGTPLYYDDLSYGGNTFILSSLFPYLTALLIYPVLVKIIPNLIAVSLIIIVFLLTKHMTRDTPSALFAAFFSAFIPVWMRISTTSLGPHILVIPLMFLLLLLFFNISSKAARVSFLIILAFTSVISPLVLVLILSLLFYLGLQTVENTKRNKGEVEFVLFSSVFLVWLYEVLYKKVIIKFGVDVIRQNIPQEAIGLVFKKVTTLQAVYLVGVLPFIGGIVVILLYLSKSKSREAYLLISMASATTLLLWLRFIPIDFGLAILGMVLAVLSGTAYVLVERFLRKTKFHALMPLFIVVLIIGAVFTSVIPSITATKNSLHILPEEYRAMEFLSEQTPENATIVVPVNRGHMTAFLAQRKTIADNQFLSRDDAASRLFDLRKIYRGRYGIKAVETMGKYGASYLYISPAVEQVYDVDALFFLGDDDCFVPVFEDNEVFVYALGCLVS
jgi:hypothetical protein